MQFEFSIRSSTRYLKFLRQMAACFCRMLGDRRVDHHAVAALSLALVEAVNNAVFHAHQRDSGRWIDVAFAADDRSVEIRVSDDGEGFEMPEESEPPMMETHGRGIFLIRSLMHEVQYRRGDRNVLVMKYLL